MEPIYNTIGKDYNRTRKADPYLVSQIIQYLEPREKLLYLDIGCGTGNYTSALDQKGFSLIGLDPSETMLTNARKNNPSVQWHLGKAEETGLPDKSIDGILGTLTIHHWENLVKAFQELKRVLKDNGRLVLFTATPEQMEGYWLNYYFPQMLKDSIAQMPSLDNIQGAMLLAGLEITKTATYVIRPDLQDHFLYFGKEKPELYLNDHIRAGISSFSALSNIEEVEKGLQQLESDIHSGAIHSIMESYVNDSGDYLFVVAE